MYVKFASGRRDLIERRLDPSPNSVVVSRDCPHVCHFRDKETFFQGGRGFYTEAAGRILQGDRELYDTRSVACRFAGERGMEE